MPEEPGRLDRLRGAAEPDDGVRALLRRPDSPDLPVTGRSILGDLPR